MHYSLGAAIASLCALDLRQQHPHVKMAQYTFGQPRVGNKVSDKMEPRFLFLTRTGRTSQCHPSSPRIFTNFLLASTMILTGASLTTVTLCRTCRSCALGFGQVESRRISWCISFQLTLPRAFSRFQGHGLSPHSHGGERLKLRNLSRAFPPPRG